ncbi:myotubularin-related protein 14 [Cylas formicarius]|uniref:myotubularin-related protein 14 n=1 Tax=Cylas formicarius TaxID=197179 RepID=UPI0029587A11|nr:myotubularin-related protein 14 [Cylas formicarius]
MENVKEEILQIQKLLKYFSITTYVASTTDVVAHEILTRCINLLEVDYNIIKLPNNDGNLSFHYPSTIPLIDSEKRTSYEDNQALDEREILELLQSAKLARCRQRFPVPVIKFRGKNICRSATLASIPEICYRSGFQELNLNNLLALKEFLYPSEDTGTDTLNKNFDEVTSSTKEELSQNWPHCNNVRNQDIKLLKMFNTMTIIDLMVEKRKCKYGLYVSSSEKVDSERFSDFKIVSFPYPGCEFFTKFHDKLLSADKLKFDWDHPSYDATLSVPENTLNIQWEGYKDWDLITITQNYLKYILRSLQEESSGILIHCISGWDRTPLFISLLRLSLWADGLIHQSLDEYQIIYLTIGYDWMLFGHHLANRLHKKEEIFYFCFYMLKFIASDDFSLRILSNGHGSNLSLDSWASASDMLSAPSTHSSSKSDSHIDEVNGNGMDINLSSLSPIPSPAGSCQDTSPISGADGESSKSSPDTPFKKRQLQASTETCAKRVASDHGSVASSPRSSLRSSKHSLPLSIRVRNDSSGSGTSSSSFTLVGFSGSLEPENMASAKTRIGRLRKVRNIFTDNYLKMIRNETFGPPKTIIEHTFSFICDTLCKQ